MPDAVAGLDVPVTLRSTARRGLGVVGDCQTIRPENQTYRQDQPNGGLKAIEALRQTNRPHLDPP